MTLLSSLVMLMLCNHMTLAMLHLPVTTTEMMLQQDMVVRQYLMEQGEVPVIAEDQAELPRSKLTVPRI